VVEFSGGAGEAVLAQVLELLRAEVEDGTLVGGLGGGGVGGPAGSEVEGEVGEDLPVVLHEVLLNVVAGADLAGLEVDLEGVDLAEQEAGEGRAGVGDSLLVGAGG